MGPRDPPGVTSGKTEVRCYRRRINADTARPTLLPTAMSDLPVAEHTCACVCVCARARKLTGARDTGHSSSSRGAERVCHHKDAVTLIALEAFSFT